MTAMRSSQLSADATTADCVVRSSAAAAATRRSLGSSWGTRVSGTPRIRQLRMDSTCILCRLIHSNIHIQTAQQGLLIRKSVVLFIKNVP